jgi:hypothetical protein
MLKSENAITKKGSTLGEDFVHTAKKAISKYPDLQHFWTVHAGNSYCSLMFPKQKEDGFDVLIEVSSTEINVLIQGAHQHFDSSKGSNESKINNALTLVRDLLSSNMRTKELRAGKLAYRWDMEYFDNNQWCLENTTGLLFWNYFGKRSERILQNSTLPSRSIIAN